MTLSPTAEVRVNHAAQVAWLKLDTQRRADENRCSYGICVFRDGSACALPLRRALDTIAPAFTIEARIHPTLAAAELDAVDPEDLA